MSDWIDRYIDNSGLENKYNEPSYCNTMPAGLSIKELSLAEKLKGIIRKCVEQEKSYFTESNFRKLRFIIIDEFCFNDLMSLSKRNNAERYEYFIFMPKCTTETNEDVFKDKIAHELAHFLFKLQNRTFADDIRRAEEEKAVSEKVTEWGI